ncbi:hypothetical protein GCM10027189_30260 [Rufibacter soli]
MQEYTSFFDLTEIILFEWLIVKARAFAKSRNLDEFFYSKRRISAETHIKEDRITTIIKRFLQEGIIHTTTKGMPKTTHFTILKPRVIELLPKIYKYTNYSQLESFFREFIAESSKHKEYTNKNSKEVLKEEKGKEYLSDCNFVSSVDAPSSEPQLPEMEALLYLNNNIDEEQEDWDWLMNEYVWDVGSNSQQEWAKQMEEEKFRRDAEKKRKAETIENLKHLIIATHEERVRVFNQNSANKKPYAPLSFTKKSLDLLFEMSFEFTEDQIEHSFAAFVDAILQGQVKVKKILPYFLAKKDSDFDTAINFLDNFNINYSYREKE